jgi:hypothetical protein
MHQIGGLRDGYLQEALASTLNLVGQPMSSDYSLDSFTDETLDAVELMCQRFISPHLDTFQSLSSAECVRLGAALWASSRRGTRGAFYRQTGTGLTKAFCQILDGVAEQLYQVDIRVNAHNECYLIAS